MLERIEPITIDVQYNYKSYGLDLAKKDIERFSTSAGSGLEKTRSNLNGLIGVYDKLKGNVTLNNADIQKAMQAVENSIDKARVAYGRLQNQTRTSQTYSSNLLSIRKELEQKGNIIDEKGDVYALNKQKGIYEKNEAATRRLASAFNSAQNAVQNVKPALSSYNLAVQSVASAETNLVAKQNSLNESLNKTPTSANNAQNGISGLTAKLNNLKKAISGIRFISLLAYIGVFRRVARAAMSFIDASSSWIENLNLLEVTFDNTADAAKEFIDVTANNFGLDKNALAQYISTFKQMANAMGQARETGTQLSEVLTLIALDVASLRNVDIATAVSDFTSALAGQVKPVRKYGFDITMYSIDELMEELGMGSVSRTMSQANKQLARAILLVRQSQDAWGDMAKTINTFANQQRVLNDQFETTKRLLGNVFIGTLEMDATFEEAMQTAGFATKAIWYFNGALMAINEVLKVFVPETTSVGVTSIAAGAEEATDAIEDMTDATEGSLASFDKFNTLTSGSGAIESQQISDMLSSLLNEEYNKYMAAYEERLANINMYAKEIANSLLAVIYTDFGAWLNKAENAGKSFSDWVEEAGITADDLKNGITDIAKNIGGLVGLVAFLTKPLVAVSGIIAVLFVQNEEFRNSVVKISVALENLAMELGASFADFIVSITPIIQFIAEIINSILKLNEILGTTSLMFYGVITAMIAFKAVNIVGSIIKIIATLKELNITVSATKALMVTGIIAIIIILTDLISNWDRLSASGKAFRIVLLTIITTLMLLPTINKITSFFGAIVSGITKTTVSVKGLNATIVGFVAGISLLTLGITTFVQGFDEMSKTAQILIPILAALAAVLAGVAVARAAAAAGLAAPVMAGVTAAAIAAGLVLVGGTAIALAHADGGYQTGGLFYAGEDGAEWVGRQGRTSTIVNDSQMSDIMMAAVAQGVVVGNSASKQTQTKQAPIILNVNGKKFLEIVEDEGRKVGKTLARAK